MVIIDGDYANRMKVFAPEDWLAIEYKYQNDAEKEKNKLPVVASQHFEK